MTKNSIKTDLLDKIHEAQGTLRLLYLYLRDDVEVLPVEMEERSRQNAVEALKQIRRQLGLLAGYIEPLPISQLPDSQNLEELGIEYIHPDAEEYITNAPETFDGFGTKTLEWLSYTVRGNSKPLRQVAIPPQAMLSHWQINRYSSGNYVCIPAADRHRWSDLWIPISNVAPESSPSKPERD
jgi:hypothetical protein